MRDAEAAELLSDVPEEERYATWHLAFPDLRLAGYGRGARDLLLPLRLTRPLGRFLGVVPDSLLDGLYRLVARNRSFLGRLVPDRPGPRRYP